MTMAAMISCTIYIPSSRTWNLEGAINHCATLFTPINNRRFLTQFIDFQKDHKSNVEIDHYIDGLLCAFKRHNLIKAF